MDYDNGRKLVEELHERYKEKVKHLSEDIKQMSKTIKELKMELSNDEVIKVKTKWRIRMKLSIKKKWFDQLKSGEKNLEWRDAHIILVCEETGETLRKDITKEMFEGDELIVKHKEIIKDREHIYQINLQCAREAAKKETLNKVKKSIIKAVNKQELYPYKQMKGLEKEAKQEIIKKISKELGRMKKIILLILIVISMVQLVNALPNISNINLTSDRDTLGDTDWDTYNIRLGDKLMLNYSKSRLVNGTMWQVKIQNQNVLRFKLSFIDGYWLDVQTTVKSRFGYFEADLNQLFKIHNEIFNLNLTEKDIQRVLMIPRKKQCGGIIAFIKWVWYL